MHFTRIAVEFCLILTLCLHPFCIKAQLMVLFVDYVLVAAKDHAMLRRVFHETDKLAEHLGVNFKKSKDVGYAVPITALDFLGIWVPTD